MNREIKFRAWDKKEKVMCKVGVINLEKGCFLVGNSPTPEQWVTDKMFIASVTEGHFVYFEDLVLMRYTGPKDKNGKEIYEGDINQDGGVIIWNDDDASFCWQYKDIETMPMERESEWCIIVGNRYENPELLTT